MQASTEVTGKKQGSNTSKIRNAGPRMDTFLMIKEGYLSRRDTKRKPFYGDLAVSQDDHEYARGSQSRSKLPRHLTDAQE